MEALTGTVTLVFKCHTSTTTSVDGDRGLWVSVSVECRAFQVGRTILIPFKLWLWVLVLWNGLLKSEISSPKGLRLIKLSFFFLWFFRKRLPYRIRWSLRSTFVNLVQSNWIFCTFHIRIISPTILLTYHIILKYGFHDINIILFCFFINWTCCHFDCWYTSSVFCGIVVEGTWCRCCCGNEWVYTRVFIDYFVIVQSCWWRTNYQRFTYILISVTVARFFNQSILKFLLILFTSIFKQCQFFYFLTEIPSIFFGRFFYIYIFGTWY